MVELMQRLALEPTTVTIDRDWDVNCWGIGDYYDGTSTAATATTSGSSTATSRRS